jgi:sortase A
LIVLEGASGRNLAFGPAHDPASAMPGEPGNSVIEGHRDTHFAVLRGIKTGDTLRVETLTRRDVDFVVTDIRVVDSRRARIALGAEQPRLTLVTCYPFDAPVPGGPLRLVVTADAIHYVNAHQ